MAWRALTDAQWERVRPHLPREKHRPQGGRPRADPRRCFEGILWVLWTGAPWSELPPRYGSATTCWRRLRQWEETGVLLVSSVMQNSPPAVTENSTPLPLRRERKCQPRYSRRGGPSDRRSSHARRCRWSVGSDGKSCAVWRW